jgi:hypothetical protein
MIARALRLSPLIIADKTSRAIFAVITCWSIRVNSSARRAGLTGLDEISTCRAWSSAKRSLMILVKSVTNQHQSHVSVVPLTTVQCPRGGTACVAPCRAGTRRRRGACSTLGPRTHSARTARSNGVESRRARSAMTRPGLQCAPVCTRQW